MIEFFDQISCGQHHEESEVQDLRGYEQLSEHDQGRPENQQRLALLIPCNSMRHYWSGASRLNRLAW